MAPSIFSKKSIQANLLPAITRKPTFFLAATLLLNSTFSCLNANAQSTAAAERAIRQATPGFSRGMQRIQRQTDDLIDDLTKKAKGAAGAAGLGGAYLIFGQPKSNDNESNY